MKGLMTFLLCLLLSLTVEAGVKFETYNASDLSWDIDTTCLTYNVSLADSINVPSTYLTFSDAVGSIEVIAPTVRHDTLREYIIGLDTVIILHRIECDTSFTKFFVENDSTFVQIEGITCDTIFRVEYRDVWVPKVQVWLDSLLWQKLLRILE